MAWQHFSDAVFENHVQLPGEQKFLQPANSVEYLGAAQTVMTTLRAGVAGTAVETVIREIAEKLDLFEIDEAIALLKRLHAELAGPP